MKLTLPQKIDMIREEGGWPSSALTLCFLYLAGEHGASTEELVDLHANWRDLNGEPSWENVRQFSETIST